VPIHEFWLFVAVAAVTEYFVGSVAYCRSGFSGGILLKFAHWVVLGKWGWWGGFGLIRGFLL
jgi:hypothetical protein